MHFFSLFPEAGRTARVQSRPRRSSRVSLDCESLEERQLLSAGAAASSQSGITAQPSLQVLSLSVTGPTGLTPAQVLSAYGINQITFSGGTVTGNGAGQTIAIIDAYNDPNISSDLAAFDKAYGLPAPPSFTVANLGATTTDAGWALETALDVEWAHAIAPQANIVLVEASSASVDALFNAVSYASHLAGVGVVSMSWGTSEFWGETSYDSLFTTPAGHGNVTYVAASGDSGAWSGPTYPSVSPNVLAVGGTTLTLSSSNTYVSETGWSNSTGGFSNFESEPSYQASTLASAGLSYGARTTPDVSFVADPSSGVSVYSSVDYNGQSGWFQLGGTSAAAPAWAGLVAIVDQGLATGGKGPLSTTQLLTELYSLPSSDYNDITSGNNGYSATTGYDLVTGLGTPKANQLVAGLLAANGVSEGGTTSTSSSGSTGSTSPSGSTTPTPTPTPTPSPSPTSTQSGHSHSHHTKTKTHKTNNHTTNARKKKTQQAKVQHHALTSSAADRSGNVSGSSSVSGSTSTASPISSNTTSAATATSSGSVPVVPASALPVTASGIQIAVTSAQQVQPGSTSAGAVGQILVASSSPSLGLPLQSGSIDRGAADDAGATDVADEVEPTQPAASPTDQPSMSDPAPASPEGPAQSAAVPAQPSLAHSTDDFDEALEQVTRGLRNGRFEPLATDASDREEIKESLSFGLSALIGTAALAAGGYRIALGKPEEDRARWRLRRFPTE